MDERNRGISVEADNFRQPVEGELTAPNEEATDNASGSVEPDQPAGSPEDQQAENDSHGPGI